MRPIDADTLENMGYELHRTYRQDANTMVYEVKKIADVPTIETEPNCCEYWDSESHFCALHKPQAEPVKHGRWLKRDVRYFLAESRPVFIIQCSECALYTTVKSTYCPTCGAKMEGEE